MEPSDDLKRPRARLTGDAIVVGIDVGSTTVKAVVVDPVTKEILWSDYQRHETRQAEKVARAARRASAASSTTSRARTIRTFITGSGSGPLREPIGARFVQEVNAVTMAVDHLHPDVRAVIELGGQDAKIILYQENAADRRQARDRVDERQVRVGHRRDDRQVHDQGRHGSRPTRAAAVGPVEAPPRRRQVRRLRGNGHRQPGEVGHPVERDPLLARRRDRLAEPVGAHARQHAQAAACCCSAAPTPTCPSSRRAGASGSRSPGRRAASSGRRTSPIEELIFVPKDAQYYAAFGAAIYGLHEPAERRACYRGLDPLKEFIANGRKAKLGAKAGPPLVADGSRARGRSAAPTRFPKFEHASVRSPARSSAASSASTAARPRRRRCCSTRRATCSPSSTSSRRATRSPTPRSCSRRSRRSCTTRAPRSRCSASARTGYAADVLEESLRADVNIVETVAHMMAAVKYLRRRRRDLRHRRPGHQGPVHGQRRDPELPAVEPVLGRATACCCRRWPTSSACR